MRASKRRAAAKAGHTGDFGALPSELAHLIASTLGSKDRWAMMSTCKGWFAAIESSPGLWPVYTVRLRNEKIMEDIRRLARLNRVAWHVRLLQPVDPAEAGPEAFDALAVLLSLPPTVRVLEIGIPCGGPALEALLHCEQLREVKITGDAGATLWDGYAAPTLLPKLLSLRLDGRLAVGHVTLAAHVPLGALALKGASQLTHLSLSGRWGPNMSLLCRELTTVCSLRLAVYECGRAQAKAAATMLAGLRHLTALSLALHAYRGVDLWDQQLGIHMWRGNDKPWVYPPPMGPLAAALTQLRLVGAVSLPPDWRQLSRLQRLSVDNDAEWSRSNNSWWLQAPLIWGWFDWGEASLAGLASLEDININSTGVLPEPELLATAPQLRWVTAPGCSSVWRHKLQILCPRVHIYNPAASLSGGGSRYAHSVRDSEDGASSEPCSSDDFNTDGGSDRSAGGGSGSEFLGSDVEGKLFDSGDELYGSDNGDSDDELPSSRGGGSSEKNGGSDRTISMGGSSDSEG